MKSGSSGTGTLSPIAKNLEDRPRSIAIVVLSYNMSVEAVRCLESLRIACSQLYKSEYSVHIYLVDNGSGEDDKAIIASEIVRFELNVHYVDIDTNLGFSGGVNRGIQAASSLNPSYFWILNADVVVGDASIKELIEFSLENPSAAIVGSQVRSLENDTLHSSLGYRYYPAWGLSRPIKSGNATAICGKESRVAKRYVDGCAIWAKGSFIRRIVKVPETSFLYFEELRLGRLMNESETLQWCRGALVKHQIEKHSKESQTRAYYASLSAFTYTRDFHRFWLPTVIGARLIGLSLRSALRRDSAALSGCIHALISFFGRGQKTIFR